MFHLLYKTFLYVFVETITFIIVTNMIDHGNQTDLTGYIVWKTDKNLNQPKTYIINDYYLLLSSLVPLLCYNNIVKSIFTI